MIFGVEVWNNGGIHYQFELKSKRGIMNRLEKYGIGKIVDTIDGKTIVPIDNNRFAVYTRTTYKNKYDKSSYSKLIDGNLKGSWEF